MRLHEANYMQNPILKKRKREREEKNLVISFNVKEGGRSIRAASHNPIEKAKIN